MRGEVLALVWAIAVLAGGPAGAEPSAQAALDAGGIRAGLVVHVGTTDGWLEADWATSGRLVLVSPDATNEGVSRPVEHFQLVIDPTDPPR